MSTRLRTTGSPNSKRWVLVLRSRIRFGSGFGHADSSIGGARVQKVIGINSKDETPSTMASGTSDSGAYYHTFSNWTRYDRRYSSIIYDLWAGEPF
jgi:hypothetical protein